MLETVVDCGFEAAIEVVVGENRMFDEFLGVVHEYTWSPNMNMSGSEYPINYLSAPHSHHV